MQSQSKFPCLIFNLLDTNLKVNIKIRKQKPRTKSSFLKNKSEIPNTKLWILLKNDVLSYQWKLSNDKKGNSDKIRIWIADGVEK